MSPFDPAKTFQQIRTESQREREAAAEASRRTWEAWEAEGRRGFALRELIQNFPSDRAGGTAEVGRVTALMVEYAQTLPVERVKRRVAFVRERLAKLAEEGQAARDSVLKEILLHLLLLARDGDHAKVAEIFKEALRGETGDVAAFHWCLINWLVDKVVDGLPPLPDEVKPPVKAPAEHPEVSVGLDVASSDATAEEWLPASAAVERAERCGHAITLKWLTQDACKHGVRIRPRQQPGRHKQEVEWASLAGYLLKRALPEDDGGEEEISARIREAQEQRRRERFLD
ncbi:MAG TPA: hypothetical protein VMF69_20595 [Gemmataceae bacterium]|nr:hypothetical protein [Gemmataceae bacterium]